MLEKEFSFLVGSSRYGGERHWCTWCLPYVAAGRREEDSVGLHHCSLSRATSLNHVISGSYHGVGVGEVLGEVLRSVFRFCMSHVVTSQMTDTLDYELSSF
jgi:hypothetical protein